MCGCVKWGHKRSLLVCSPEVKRCLLLVLTGASIWEVYTHSYINPIRNTCVETIFGLCPLVRFKNQNGVVIVTMDVKVSLIIVVI